MTNTARPGRGQYIQYLFILGDVAIVNLLFWLTITCFPTIKEGAHYLRELWLLVNISYLPVLAWSSGHHHERRAIRMEYVMRSALLTVGTHALFFL